MTAAGAGASELGAVFVSVVPSLAGAMGSMKAGGSEAAMGFVSAFSSTTKSQFSSAFTDLPREINDTFKGIGATAAQTFMSSFQQMTSGKMPDFMKMFDGLEEAAFKVLDLAGTMSGVGAPFVAVLEKTLKPAFDSFKVLGGEFMQTMLQVGDTYLDMTRKIAGSTVNTEAIEGLAGAVRDIAASGAVVRFGDVADAIGRINSNIQGLNMQQLKDFTTTFAEAEELVGNIDKNKMLGVFNAWKLGPEEVDDALTRMTNTARITGISVDEMTGEMTRSGPAMRTLGYNIDQTASFFGKMSQEGERGTRLIFAMNDVVKKLNDQVEKGTFKNVQEGWTTVINAVKEYTAANDDAGALKTLEQYVSPSTATLMLEDIKNHIIDISSLMKDMPGLDEKLEDGVEKTKSLGDAWMIVGQQIQAALSPIGMYLAHGLMGASGSISSWLKENQGHIAVWAADVSGIFLEVMGKAATFFADTLAAAAPFIGVFKDMMVEVFGFIEDLMKPEIDLLSKLPGSLGQPFKDLKADFGEINKLGDKVWHFDIQSPLKEFDKSVHHFTENTLPDFNNHMQTMAQGFKDVQDISNAMSETLDGKVKDAFVGFGDPQSPTIRLLGDPAQWDDIKNKLQSLGVMIKTNQAGVITSINFANDEAKKTWEKWYADQLANPHTSAMKIQAKDADGNDVTDTGDLVQPGTSSLTIIPGVGPGFTGNINAFPSGTPQVPGGGGSPGIGSSAQYTPGGGTVTPGAPPPGTPQTPGVGSAPAAPGTFGYPPGTAAPSVPSVAPPAAPGAAPSTGGVDWDKLCQLEASGNWAINTGNGFFGGLQFTQGTWDSFAPKVLGAGYPTTANLASREQQIAVGAAVLAAQGPGAWPKSSHDHPEIFGGTTSPGSSGPGTAPPPSAPTGTPGPVYTTPPQPSAPGTGGGGGGAPTYSPPPAAPPAASPPGALGPGNPNDPTDNRPGGGGHGKPATSTAAPAATPPAAGTKAPGQVGPGTATQWKTNVDGSKTGYDAAGNATGDYIPNPSPGASGTGPAAVPVPGSAPVPGAAAPPPPTATTAPPPPTSPPPTPNKDNEYDPREFNWNAPPPLPAGATAWIQKNGKVSPYFPPPPSAAPPPPPAPAPGAAPPPGSGPGRPGRGPADGSDDMGGPNALTKTMMGGGAVLGAGGAGYVQARFGADVDPGKWWKNPTPQPVGAPGLSPTADFYARYGALKPTEQAMVEAAVRRVAAGTASEYDHALLNHLLVENPAAQAASDAAHAAAQARAAAASPGAGKTTFDWNPAGAGEGGSKLATAGKVAARAGGRLLSGTVGAVGNMALESIWPSAHTGEGPADTQTISPQQLAAMSPQARDRALGPKPSNPLDWMHPAPKTKAQKDPSSSNVDGLPWWKRYPQNAVNWWNSWQQGGPVGFWNGGGVNVDDITLPDGSKLPSAVWGDDGRRVSPGWERHFPGDYNATNDPGIQWHDSPNADAGIGAGSPGVRRLEKGGDFDPHQWHQENYGHPMYPFPWGYAAANQFGGSISRWTGGDVPWLSGTQWGQDGVHAVLAPGEHVWTTGEVKAAGGHGSMYGMREAVRKGQKPVFMEYGGDVTAAYAMAGTGYSMPNRTDCSGMVARVVDEAIGVNPSQGDLMSTMNAGQWLGARGFQEGAGGPGEMTVYWYDHGGGENGHMAMILSNGQAAQQGGNSDGGGGDKFEIGGKVDFSQFDHAMHRPPGVMGQGAAGFGGVPQVGGGGGGGLPGFGGGGGGGGAGGGAGGGGFFSGGGSGPVGAPPGGYPQGLGPSGPIGPGFNPWTNPPHGLTYQQMQEYTSHYMEWQKGQADSNQRLTISSREAADAVTKQKDAFNQYTTDLATWNAMDENKQKANPALLTKIQDEYKKLDAANSDLATKTKSNQDALDDQAIHGTEGPPKAPKPEEGQTDKDAQSLGSGLVKGIFQELGFPDVFGKSFNQWGIWKLAMGGLGFGMDLMQNAGGGAGYPGSQGGPGAAAPGGNPIARGLEGVLGGLLPGMKPEKPDQYGYGTGGPGTAGPGVAAPPPPGMPPPPSAVTPQMATQSAWSMPESQVPSAAPSALSITYDQRGAWQPTPGMKNDVKDIANTTSFHPQMAPVIV